MKKTYKSIKKNLKRISRPVSGMLFSALGRIAMILNRQQSKRLADFLGDFTFDFLRMRRSLTEANLKQTFPEKSSAELRRITRKIYRRQALNIVELLRIPLIRNQSDALKMVNIETDEAFRKVLRQRQGAVVVSAHLSSWEVIGVCAGLLLSPLNIIIKPQRNSYLNVRLNQLRTLHGNMVIAKDKALREGLYALKNSGIVVILGDQSKRHGNFYTEFLGRESSVVLGPAFLALKAGVPLFVETCRMLDNGRYQVNINEVRTDDLNYTREDIRTLTIRYTIILEGFIRSHPEEWLWLHDRWKKSASSNKKTRLINAQ